MSDIDLTPFVWAFLVTLLAIVAIGTFIQWLPPRRPTVGYRRRRRWLR